MSGAVGVTEESGRKRRWKCEGSGEGIGRGPPSSAFLFIINRGMGGILHLGWEAS